MTINEEYFKIQKYMAKVDFENWLYFTDENGKEDLRLYSAEQNNHHVVDDRKNKIQYTFWSNTEDLHVDIESELNDSNTIEDLYKGIQSPKVLLKRVKKALAPIVEEKRLYGEQLRKQEIERLEKKIADLKGEN